MKPTMRSLVTISCLCLAAFASAPLHANAFRFQFNSPWYCNGNPVRIGQHFGMTPRCADGTFSSLTSGTSADLAESGWRAWWDLDQTNSAVWIVRSGACTSTRVWGVEDERSIASAPSVLIGGTGMSIGTMADFTWNDCAVAGTPFTTEIDLEVASGLSQPPAFCAHGLATYDGTWIHEVGHGYQFDHFDDWLSTMNSNTPDITSCTPTRVARASSDAQQGMAALYGLPAGFDYGSSPIVQTGTLSTTGGGWWLPGYVRTFPATTTNTHFSATVDVTRMNMRDAWPTGTGNVRMEVWLSSDRTFSSSADRLIATTIISTGLHAGAIYPYKPTITFLTSLLAPGEIKWVIVRWSTPGVAEVREDDNVMDTGIRYWRAP